MQKVIGYTLYAFGLFGTTLTIVLTISLLTYGGQISFVGVLMVVCVSLALLAISQLLPATRLPYSIVLFSVIALCGLQLTVLPFQQRWITQWSMIDFALLLIGASMLSGSVLWAQSKIRKRPSGKVDIAADKRPRPRRN